jgi:tetratricopeptide (TPR) repeat protein
MHKLVRTLFASMLALIGVGEAAAQKDSDSVVSLQVSAGDVITSRDGEKWALVKVLAVDTWPDGSRVAHCMTFKSMQEKPSLGSAAIGDVLIWHAPINAASFQEKWELLGNQQPKPEEMAGFLEYLKLQDFPRYLEVSGQDAKELISRANRHYQTANQLAEQGKKIESLAEYTQAIELFPLFFEAIDNRAFTHMELGDYAAALEGFEQSLAVNPDGVSAFFSKGECLMKLGRLSDAEAVFKQGIRRFPSQQSMFADFLARVRRLKSGG